MGEKGHGFIEDRVQVPLIYMTIDPICSVLCLALIRFLLGGSETECFESGGTGHAEFLDDLLILPPRKKLVIDQGLSNTPRPVRLGMMKMIKYLLFIGSCGNFDT